MLSLDEAYEIGKATADNMNAIVLNEMTNNYVEDDVSYSGLLSYEEILTDVGEYFGVLDVMSFITEDTAEIYVAFDGSVKDGYVKLLLGKDGCSYFEAFVFK